ncbi:transcriptional antiterminator NusG [Salmonella enterica]|uniref:Transcriptional antiterminator NusG n=1 Tax=Salmonella enterica TaxID=28901 RepID=A0A5U1RE76_SALER|nr:transcriptional antiterminator NusG [Salmonella enterica]
MYKWYVLYCNSQDVDHIIRRVKLIDVKAFCPRYIKVTTRKDCHAVRLEDKALFPNYLFLFFDVNKTHTSTITSIPGAHGFVKFGATPCVVPASVILTIRCARLMALNPDENAIECRNIAPDLLAKIQELSLIRSPLQRQVAFSRLLQNQYH